MTITTHQDLETLLERAAAAPPNERMHLRNDVATYGEDALAQLEPWLIDGRLATFAVRTIGRIGEDPATRTRASAMLSGASAKMTEHARKDAAFILAGWRTPVVRRRAIAKAKDPDVTTA
jgi:hypothetical protein